MLFFFDVAASMLLLFSTTSSLFYIDLIFLPSDPSKNPLKIAAYLFAPYIGYSIMEMNGLPSALMNSVESHLRFN